MSAFSDFWRRDASARTAQRAFWIAYFAERDARRDKVRVRPRRSVSFPLELPTEPVAE